jgi:hypothetical protein
METPNKLWAIFRALALAALAGFFAGVGTAFALFSFNSMVLGRGHSDPMDPLGFVLGAVGWLVAWGAWRLARGRPGAWLVKWTLIAIALGEPVLWAFFDAISGIMMHA